LTQDPADPELKPGWVNEKTNQEFGSVKPGRSEESTQVNLAETWLFIYIYKSNPICSTKVSEEFKFKTSFLLVWLFRSANEGKIKLLLSLQFFVLHLGKVLLTR
jgi:hypothetical protein